MQIVRDGKTYELTIYEMAQAAQELYILEQTKDAEANQQWNARHKSPEEWNEFLVDNELQNAPFPLNLLLDCINNLFGLQRCRDFLAWPEEEREALANEMVASLYRLGSETLQDVLLDYYKKGMSEEKIARQWKDSIKGVKHFRECALREMGFELIKIERLFIAKKCAAAVLTKVEISDAYVLGRRTKMYLEAAGIKTLAQLFAMTQEEVRAIPGMAFQFNTIFPNTSFGEIEKCAHFYAVNARHQAKDR